MKNLFLALVCCLCFCGAANAMSTTVDFPGTSSTYFSATNGGGTITPGGSTVYMWTTGDYVTATFVTGLPSVDSIAYHFQYRNVLAQNELVNILLNGNLVGSFTAPASNYSGNTYDAIGSDSFGDIFSSGGIYTLSLVLQDTLPGGAGSLAFYDGGVVTLSNNDAAAVPEPSTMLLLGGGLVGLACLRRRKSA